MPTKITVTREDINAGCREVSHSCPVALATKRAFPDSEVHAYRRLITVTDLSGQYRAWDPPETVSQFIDDFDRKREVLPFEFELPDNPKREQLWDSSP